MTEHPIESAMDYPLDGCDCDMCEYARWYDALTPEEQRAELDMIYAYAEESA